MFMLVLENHAHRTLPDFRGIPHLLRHCQILSKNLASDKPGAIQPVTAHPVAGDVVFWKIDAIDHPTVAL